MIQRVYFHAVWLLLLIFQGSKSSKIEFLDTSAEKYVSLLCNVNESAVFVESVEILRNGRTLTVNDQLTIEADPSRFSIRHSSSSVSVHYTLVIYNPVIDDAGQL